VESAGGIILESRGNQENTFEWGLARASKNQVEALTLFQQLRIVDENHIKIYLLQHGN
jgi:hypothetical protein